MDADRWRWKWRGQLYMWGDATGSWGAISVTRPGYQASAWHPSRRSWSVSCCPDSAVIFASSWVQVSICGRIASCALIPHLPFFHSSPAIRLLYDYIMITARGFIITCFKFTTIFTMRESGKFSTICAICHCQCSRTSLIALGGYTRGSIPTWGTGREDADVRMLGGGRPYVLEIINARAAMPPQSYFDAAQLQLNAVRDTGHS